MYHYYFHQALQLLNLEVAGVCALDGYAGMAADVFARLGMDSIAAGYAGSVGNLYPYEASYLRGKFQGLKRKQRGPDNADQTNKHVVDLILS